MFKFSDRSLASLQGVHPHLRALTAATLAESAVDFTVICGLRSRAEQEKLVAMGKSQTMHSRHLTGHAVDLAAIAQGGGFEWNDVTPYIAIRDTMFAIADKWGVPIRWGGDWDRDGDHRDERFLDAFHFELERDAYPAEQPHPPEVARDLPDDIRALLRLDPEEPDPETVAACAMADRRARQRAMGLM